MKRGLTSVVVCVSLLLLFGEEASSQLRFGVGLRTGLNFGTMSFDPQPYTNIPTVEKGGRTGFLVGAAAELEFARMFAGEVDFIYVSGGAEFTDNRGQGSDKVKISELQIPILFKVKFLPGPIRPYAFAGPVLGIVTSATDVFEETGRQAVETDLKSNPNGLQVSSLDFALTFGGGAEYLITRQFGILLDVRYALGLSNLATLPTGIQATTTPTWHTRNFMIQVGGMYHI